MLCLSSGDPRKRPLVFHIFRNSKKLGVVITVYILPTHHAGVPGILVCRIFILNEIGWDDSIAGPIGRWQIADEVYTV